MSDKIINECDVECDVCQKNVLKNSLKENITKLKMNLRDLSKLVKKTRQFR